MCENEFGFCCWQVDVTVNQPEGRISYFLVERSTVYSVELKGLINLTRKTFFVFFLHNENRSILKPAVLCANSILNFLRLKERWYYEITACRLIFPILALLLQDYLLYYFICFRRHNTVCFWAHLASPLLSHSNCVTRA